MQAVRQVTTFGFAAAALFAAGVMGGLHGTLLLVTPMSVALLGCVLAVQRWGASTEVRP